MITYVSRYIPNVSQLMTPLRQLIKKDVIWSWNKEHDKAFKQLKEILIREPILKYFDPAKPITVSVDASKEGLGVVLLQDDLPVAYASKALNLTQQAYAQIEKETLAIVFGCERFHQYIYGKNFIVESDHKPLEAIFKKPLHECPARLQRMRMKLLQYDATIVYKKRKELYLADALSRASIDDKENVMQEELEAQVGLITESINITRNQVERFIEETKKDKTLQNVIKLVRTGWPDQKNAVPDSAKPYFTFKEDLHEIKELLFKNNCLVVPTSLRSEMLEKIHFNHMGIEKCKLRARECLYWPGMSNDIENLVTNCEACAKYQRLNRKEPLKPWQVPEAPWQVLGTDLLYLNGNDYLLIIDYFSKYVELSLMKSTTTIAVIQVLKSCFARYGIPLLLISDNGPQYNSSKMKEFAREWNFEHRTSSPIYAQSNGMAEKYIGTVKSMLKKAMYDGRDPYLALLEYRNTPITAEIGSPTELMFGRKIRGLLPYKEQIFSNNRYDKTKNKLETRQQIQKAYYDRGVVNAKPLRQNDEVFVQKNNNEKERAIVIEECDRPRSYKVKLESGNIVERNRKHLFKFEPKTKFNEQYPTIDLTENDDTESGNVTTETNNLEEVPVTSDDKVEGRLKRLIKKPKYLDDYIT